MEKHIALAHFDGSVKLAAAEIGCTQEAVRMWPDPLPPRIRDRVQAALWRRERRALPASEGEAQPGTEPGNNDRCGEAVHGGNVVDAAIAPTAYLPTDGQSQTAAGVAE